VAFEEHKDARLIITDNSMSGIKGVDVARFIREKDLNVKIILASGDFSNLSSGNLVYFNKFLPKPFGISDAKEVIGEFVVWETKS